MARSGRNGDFVKYEMVGHSAAMWAGRVYVLLLRESETLYGAAFSAFPHVVVNRVEAFLEVLARIQKLVVLLLSETVHLRATCVASHGFPAVMAFEPKGQKGECQCRSAGGDGAYPIYRHVLGPCLRLVEIAFLTPSEKVGAEQEQGEDESDAADYPQELHYHVAVQCFHSRRISSLTALQLFGVCRKAPGPCRRSRN